MLAESGRGVVEMQHGSRRLDDVPVALRAAEAVVSGQTEVLVAAAAVWQLKHLAGNHRLLLGHAGGVDEKDQFNRIAWRQEQVSADACRLHAVQKKLGCSK